MRFAKSFFLFLIVSLIISTIFILPASAANTQDYVDNNSSDVDSHADHGTESSFAAEQSAPDSTYDTLTEANTAAAATNTTLLNDGFEGAGAAWDDNWDQNGATTWDQSDSTTYGAPWSVHGGTYMAAADSADDGELETDNLDMSTATAFYVSFWYMDDDTDDADDFLLNFWDGAAYDTILELGLVANEDVWTLYSARITDSQYFDSTFRMQIIQTSPDSGEVGFIDDVLIIREVTPAANYELDLERQWTSADYDESNEELCIYTGSMNAENLDAYVWDGEEFQLVIDNLVASQWNNASIVGYLTGTTLTMKFMAQTEIADTTQSSWQIDSVLIHTWTPGTDFIADLSLAASTTWNLIAQTNFNTIHSQSVTSSWDTVLQWNAIADITQAVTSSWSILANLNSFVDLSSSATLAFSTVIQWNAIADFTLALTASWTMVIQSTFNVINSLGTTFTWLIDLVQTTFSGTAHIADLSLSVNTVWAMLVGWTANVDLSQTFATTWSVLIQSNFNIISSLGSTFTFILDIIKGVSALPQNYIADLSLAISSSWAVDLISGLQLNVDLSLDVITTWVLDWVEGNAIEEWMAIGAIFSAVIIGSMAFALFMVSRRKNDYD